MARSTPLPGPEQRLLRTTFRQAMRLGRRGVPFGPLALAAITAAFVSATLIALVATSLSPQQERAREFGSFHAKAGYGILSLAPGDGDVVPTLAHELSRSTASSFMVLLHTSQFYVAGMSDDGSTRFEELDWSIDRNRPNHHLLQGRWPTAPGEVAITGSADVRLGSELRVPPSRSVLKVVGQVEDDYNNQPVLLAAPGTWQQLDSRLGERFETVRADVTVSWSGGSKDDVLKAISRGLSQHGDGSPKAVRAQVRNSYYAASEIEEERTSGWVDRVPIGYTIPSVILPVMAGIFAFALSERRWVRLRRITTALGLPPTILLGGFGAVLLAALAAASIAGGVIGIGLVHLLRPLLAEVAGRPVDLAVPVVAPILRFSALTVLTGAVALLLVIRRAKKQTTLSDGAEQVGRTEPLSPSVAGRSPARTSFFRITADDLRRLLALAAICYSLLQLPGMDTPAGGMRFAAGTAVAYLLVLPDLLPIAVGLLPERGWVPRLVKRRMIESRQSSLALVSVVSLVVGLAFGYLTLLDTWVTSADGERAPDSAPGQVFLKGEGSFDPPDPQVQNLVERSLKARATAVPLFRAIDREFGDKDTDRRATLPALDGVPLILSDASDLELILGRDLTADEVATLNQSGVLIWRDELLSELAMEELPEARVSAQIEDVAGKRLEDTVVLPARVVAAPPGDWRSTTAGVMTRAGAEGRGFPVSGGALLYTGVDDQEVAQIRSAVVEEGFTRDSVLTYEELPPLVPAAALPAVGFGLTVLLLALATAATWTGARALQRFVSMLVYLGIAPARARTVVLLQNGFLFLVAVGFGLCLAAVPTAVTLFALSGYIISVPWTAIGSLTLALFFACAVASFAAVARIKAVVATPGD